MGYMAGKKANANRNNQHDKPRSRPISKNIDLAVKKKVKPLRKNTNKIDEKRRAEIKHNAKIQIEEWKNGLFLVARNNRGNILAKERYQKGKRSKVEDRIREKLFNRKVPEIKGKDTLKDETSKTKEKRISYNAYYRYSVLIFEMQKGRKYTVLYQINKVDTPGHYISMGEVIALLKEDISRTTGMSLEEWVRIAQASDIIYMEGGIRLKRFKGVYDYKTNYFQYKKDYDEEIDLSRL